MKKKKIKKLKLEMVFLGYQDKHTKNGPILYPPPPPTLLIFWEPKGKYSRTLRLVSWKHWKTIQPLHHKALQLL